MKGATECARRLKRLIRSLRAKLGKGGRRTSGDAITQMILGVFSRDVPESKARAALDRLRGMVVDYNELRVVPAIEAADAIASLPGARLKSEDLSRSLNSVFMYEHDVSLERLTQANKKELLAYLDGLDGLDAYSRARVRLYGFGRHAFPLDEAMWAYARKTRIVDGKCSLEDAQAFLERRISEAEVLEVAALLEKQAWAEMGAAVRSGQVERISSVPPDRTSRNMLQMVAAGQSTTDIGVGQRPQPVAKQVEAPTPDKKAKEPTPHKKPARKVTAAEPKPRSAATRKVAAKPKTRVASGGKKAGQRGKAAKRGKTVKRGKVASAKTSRAKPARSTRRAAKVKLA